MKDPQRLAELIESFDEHELDVLGNLVSGLDRLAMEDGKPIYTDEEIDLIGRFLEVPEADDEDEDDSDEDDDRVEALSAERDFQENSFAPQS